MQVPDAEAATAMTLAVVELWKTNVFLVVTSPGEQFLTDVHGLTDLAGDEFAREGTLSVVRIESMGGCTFDFSIGEAGDKSGELLAAAWGDAEDLIGAMSERDSRAAVFRGN
jgi:hypothetical protein